MRKTLFAILAMSACVAVKAQITLFDNGPMITHAGQGFGGADLSMCSLDPNTAGQNRKFFGPEPEYFSMADDFTLNQNATLTSVVLYGYETNANTPTWATITVNLWSGKPGAGGAVIATATSTSVAQTNIFRCFNGVFVDSARKINSITATFSNIALNSGTTYWVSSQITTGGATGWANMVMDIDPANPNNPITRAGNALQFRLDTVTNVRGWWPANSGTTNIVNSEFPMLIKGNPATSTETLAPVSEQILLGTQASGGNLASWAANDGNNRKVCKFLVPFAGSPFIRLNLNYTTTKPAPTAISFDVKVGVDPSAVQRITLKMQNKVTNSFVNTSVVGVATATGVTYNGVPSGTLSDYVGGGGAMTGQIEILAVGIQSSSFPCLEFDSGLMVVTG